MRFKLSVQTRASSSTTSSEGNFQWAIGDSEGFPACGRTHRPVIMSVSVPVARLIWGYLVDLRRMGESTPAKSAFCHFDVKRATRGLEAQRQGNDMWR